MLASLLDVFIEAELLKEAVNCFGEIKKNHSTFNIDIYKIINLATLYVKSGQYDGMWFILKYLNYCY